MARRFNITGNCFRKEHYMADVSRKLVQVRLIAVQNTGALAQNAAIRFAIAN